MNHAAIKAARESMGMTPADLAEIMEIGPREIYRIESNSKTARKPPARFLTVLKALVSGWRP
jgi:transcriptional regulator with XRE-family HTH domain